MDDIIQNQQYVIMYSTSEGDVRVQAIVKDETLWLTQRGMAILFDVGVPAINKHLHNIFKEGELMQDVVVSKMEITTQHGAIEGKTQTKEVAFYNLDAIISVGYRVNSIKATRFRQWATKVLKEFMQKGFALDDKRRFRRYFVGMLSLHKPILKTQMTRIIFFKQRLNQIKPNCYA